MQLLDTFSACDDDPAAQCAHVCTLRSLRALCATTLHLGSSVCCLVLSRRFGSASSPTEREPRLYLDDPNDSTAEVLEKSGWVLQPFVFGNHGGWSFHVQVQAGFVELVPVDAQLREQWPTMPSWRHSPGLQAYESYGFTRRLGANVFWPFNFPSRSCRALR